MNRRLVHLLILLLLCGVPLVTGMSANTAPKPGLLLGGGPPTANAAAPAAPTGPVAAPAVPAAAPAGSVGAPAAAPVAASVAAPTGADSAPPISPRAAAPAAPPAPARTGTIWVQAFRATGLWASERPDAANLGSLSQWTHLRQLGEAIGSRMPVEYPGDGQSKLPLRGWVETVDVGPAGRPDPDHELAFGGNVSPSTGVQVPRRTVQAWPQGISAQFAVLVDEASGEILWGRNAHGRVAPASLTKIITSLVAIDRSRPSDRVAVRVDSRDAYFWESTTMGLTSGQNLSMETLLYGLMLPSGNDAALAIALHLSGSEPAFADLMNAKAAQLGLANSRFVNPHGLDADGHYSSPYDLAMFSRVGMRDPFFRSLANAKQHAAEGFTLHNMNRLLAIYPKADGIKVGYTDAAGRAIVASATENGRRVYVALIRSHNPTAEAQALLEWAFRGFVWQ